MTRTMPDGWTSMQWAEHLAQQGLTRYRDEMRLAPGNRNYAHVAARLAADLEKLLTELAAKRTGTRP